MQKMKNDLNTELNASKKAYLGITKQLTDIQEESKKHAMLAKKYHIDLNKCDVVSSKYTTRISELENENTELSSHLSGLKAKYDHAYTNYDKDKQELISLRKEHDSAKSTNKKLTSQITKLTKKRSKQTDTIEKLEKKLVGAYHKHKILTSEFNKLKSIYADLLLMHKKLIGQIDKCIPPELSLKEIAYMAQVYYRHNGPFTESYMVPLKIERLKSKQGEYTINYKITYRYYDVYHDEQGTGTKIFKYKFNPVECKWYLIKMVNA